MGGWGHPGGIILLSRPEQRSRNEQHFAHNSHQGSHFPHTSRQESMIVAAKGRTWEPDAMHGSHIEHAPNQSAASLRQFGFALPFPALFDFDIHARIGDHLVQALKTGDLSQFGEQDGHRLLPKFRDRLEPLGFWIIGKQPFNLGINLLQMGLSGTELLAPNVQTQFARLHCKSTAHRLVGYIH